MRQKDDSVELLFSPRPRRDPDREAQLRAACQAAGLSPTEDYLSNRGRTRVLGYPVGPLGASRIVDLLSHILLDVYRMRDGDTLSYHLAPEQPGI